jgi:TolB-like protein/Flp pilus assembly protein TadD
MSEEVGPESRDLPPASSDLHGAESFWVRVRAHKIIQWGLAYLGAALAIGQGHQLVADAFGWPSTADRILAAVLIVGFPIALTLAWYHGHRGLKSISTGELTIISMLMLIGGLFFTVSVPSSEGTSAAASREPAGEAPTNVPQPTAGAAAGSSAVTPRAPEVLPNSVAVLPCANQSPSPNDAEFAVGIHEEILMQLAKLRNLNAAPRRAVLRYAASDLDTAQIAAELGVQAVVDCSVRYADNRVRISAELIDAASERSMWSDVYERDLRDLFAIQADIAMNIANAVGAEFSSAEQAQLERPLTTSPEAYRLYMQSRALIANQSPESIRQAMLLQDRALDLDPDFALLRGTRVLEEVINLVDAISSRPIAYQDPSGVERNAREEIDRALARDPDLWVARVARATLNVYTWRWQEAIDEYRVIANDPGAVDIVPLLQYGFVTAYAGNSDEGLEYTERLLETEPDGLEAYQMRGIVEGYARDYDAAVASLRKAQELLPANPLMSNWLAYMEIARGNEAEAAAHLDFSRRVLGDQINMAFWPEFAYAYHRLGRQDEAERFYRDIERASANRSIGAGTWALASLAIGDNEKALDWLRQAAEKARNHEIDEGFYAAMNLKMNFTNDPLLNEPQFADVLSRIRGD